MEDIIKQIVLRFKAEGAEDVQRITQSIGRSMNARDIDRYSRAVESIQRRFNEMGKELPNSFEKVNRILRDLHDKELDKVMRKLERVGQVIEARLKRIEELKQADAPPEQIMRQEVALGRSLDRMARLAAQQDALARTAPRQAGQLEGLLSAQQGRGGLISTVGRAVGAVATVGGMTIQAGEMARDLLIAINRNTTVVGESYKELVNQMYRGDATRAVLYADPQRAQDIERETERMRSVDRGVNVARLVFGGLLTAGAIGVGIMALPGLIAGGMAGLAGGALLSAGLKGGAILGAGIYGASQLYQAGRYFLTGEQEAMDIQRRRMAEERAAAQTMDLDYYRAFLQRSRQRFEMGRLFGLDDARAFNIREAFRGELISEGEMPQFMLPFRVFGTRRATQLGVAAARAFTEQGLSRESAIQSLSILATTSAGGPARAAEELAQIVAKGVALGIRDAGLVDAYQQTVAQIMQALGGRVSATDVIDDLNQFMAPGRFDPARQIQGLPTAVANFGQILSGTSPLMSAVKTANLMDLVRDPRTGEFEMGELIYLESLSPMQLAMLNENDPVLQRIRQRTGMSREEMQRRVETFKQQMVTTQGSLGVSFQTAQDLRQKVERGEKITEGDLRALAAAMGQRELATMGTREALAGFGYQTLRSMGLENIQFDESMQLTPEELEEIRGTRPPPREGPEAPAAAQQRAAEIEGERRLDVAILTRIESHMGSIMERFAQQMNTMQQQLDTGVLQGSIDGVKTALDELTIALRDASAQIRSSTGWPSFLSPNNTMNTGASPAVPASPRPPGGQ